MQGRRVWQPWPHDARLRPGLTAMLGCCSAQYQPRAPGRPGVSRPRSAGLDPDVSGRLSSALSGVGRPRARSGRLAGRRQDMSTKASAPPLVVRTGVGERNLAAGRAYLIGRDPQADIVVADPLVSWHHAELRAQNGRWALVDLGSTNGNYAGGRREDLIEIDGTRQIRLGDPEDGPLLDCVLPDYAGT